MLKMVDVEEAESIMEEHKGSNFNRVLLRLASFAIEILLIKIALEVCALLIGFWYTDTSCSLLSSWLVCQAGAGLAYNVVCLIDRTRRRPVLFQFVATPLRLLYTSGAIAGTYVLSQEDITSASCGSTSYNLGVFYVVMLWALLIGSIALKIGNRILYAYEIIRGIMTGEIRYASSSKHRFHPLSVDHPSEQELQGMARADDFESDPEA